MVDVPRVMTAFGVMVNVAVAEFPRLSITVTVLAPEVAPAGTVIKNAEVPCSVTAGVAGVRAAAAVVPNFTLAALNVAVGPKPITEAVTNEPTAPEVGDRVTVGTFRVKVAVATLPWLSVKVSVGNAPAVMVGRLTVPE